jgi:peptidoglycan/xylan/chitin deacetylase (PgdA/CDA1 family)
MSNLPQNYSIRTGTLLCDSNLAALTNNSKSSGDATIVVSDNTDPAFIRPSGVGTSIKLDVTAAGTGFTIWNLDWTINTSLVNIGRFGFAYYFSPSVLTNWGLTVMLSEASNFANRYNYSPFTVAPNVARQGWNTVVLDRATPSSTTGSPNIANTFTRVRVQLQVPAGVTGTVYLCPIYSNYYNRPKIVFSFDDQDVSQYANGYEVLSSHGLLGSQCIQTGFSGGLTVAQMQEMHAAGWSFHNHSINHTNLTTVSVNEATDIMRTAQGWLDANGLRYGRSTVVFPNGATNDAVDAAMAGLGYTHGAIVRPQLDKLWDGFEQPRRINRHNTDQSFSLATLKARVDDAIKFGGAQVFYSHAIVDGATGSNTERATFAGLVEYVSRLHHAGVLDVVTLQELVDGLTNPRRRRAA